MYLNFLDSAFNKLAGGQKNFAGVDLCGDTGLTRIISVWSICIICLMAAKCRRWIERSAPWNVASDILNRSHPITVVSNHSLHTGINIALMPVLFFFSGLYYTDVVSTLMILLAFNVHLRRLRESNPRNGVALLFFGVLSLLMRQTNIFWIVVYMGGRELVAAVKAQRVNQVLVDPSRVYGSVWGLVGHFWQRYAVADVNDPTLDRMAPDGKYLECPRVFSF
jgi:alpha-1,2-glucosyltransferase